MCYSGCPFEVPFGPAAGDCTNTKWHLHPRAHCHIAICANSECDHYGKEIEGKACPVCGKEEDIESK